MWLLSLKIVIKTIKTSIYIITCVISRVCLRNFKLGVILCKNVNMLHRNSGNRMFLMAISVIFGSLDMRDLKQHSIAIGIAV